jgi:protoheme IX farnesyltransferase
MRADTYSDAVRAGHGERGLLGRARDYAVLTKPRISGFVVLAAFTGALLGDAIEPSPGRAMAAALWIGAVAAASCVFNQILERDVDRLMRRTMDRPLPSGRLGVREATLFGALLALSGTLGLSLQFNLLTALLALSTLLAYVLVYTPLKRHSSFNTVVGALPGAMPPLLGLSATAGAPEAWGWMLFAVLFTWQFPHFLAIAWLHREDYRRAGMRMLPVVDPESGISGRQAFLYALVLLPVSLLPGTRGDAGWLYVVTALMLGLLYIAAAAAFALREGERTARALLVTSLVYLPLLLSAVLLDPVVHLIRVS